MKSFAGRTPLPANKSKLDKVRSAKGPLGALPGLSSAARRALAVTGILAVGNAILLVAQGFLLASVLAAVVGGQGGSHTTVLAVLAGVVIVRALVNWALRAVSARAAAGAKEELRARVIDHAMLLGPEWISARGTAEFTALTTRGLDALDAYFTEYLPALVTAAVVPCAVGLCVLFVDWPSALIIAVTVPLLPLFAIIVGKCTEARVAKANDAVQRLSGRLTELIRVLPVLTAFGRARAQAETVRKVSDRHRLATLATLRFAFSSAFVLELAATLSVALVAVTIGMRLVSGNLALTIGLGVLVIAPECYQPVRSLGAAFHASEDGVEAVRRVAAVLDEAVESGGDEVPTRGEVRVAGLRVTRRERELSCGESFAVAPGETASLTAPSGGGKTTTLAVLLGFLRPSAGSVTVNGTPLDKIDLSAWRGQIAWVPQSPVFTEDTVRAELEASVTDVWTPEEPPTEADLEHGLRDLGLAGMLGSEPNRLSAGQRQRLAVARALLRVRAGAWLLLLDEPTAHLDAANARRVRIAIRATERAGAAVVLAQHARPQLAEYPRPDTEVADNPVENSFPVTSHTAGKPLKIRELLSGRLLLGAGLGAGALLAGISLTATSAWLIAKASHQPPILTLTVAVVAVRAFGLGRAGLRYVERLITHDAAFRSVERLRVRLWLALVHIGPARSQSLRSGEGQRRLVADIDTIRDLVPRVLTPPAIAIIVVLSAVLIQTSVLPEAGLVLAVAMVVGVTAAPWLALRLERKASSALASGRREVSAKVFDIVEAAAELIAFGRYESRRDQLAEADRRLVIEARRQAFGAGAAEAVLIAVTGAAAVLSTGLAAAAAATGRLDPLLAPLLALVPLALAEVLAFLPPAAQHWDTLRTARIRFADLLAQQRTAPRDSETDAGHADRISLRGDLRWPGADKPVLRRVYIDIPAGAHVAVIGPSGAGKSTLLAAMLGFLGPENGYFTGPERIAWSPQEPQLVATTVAENLRLADPLATDARLTEALTRTGLCDVRPDTKLGSAGAGLSGGQAQRVGLTRAMLAAENSDLVLLDEPTAHLDRASAKAVLDNVETTFAAHTLVHVTHREEEVSSCDMLIEVRDGSAQVIRATMPAPAG